MSQYLLTVPHDSDEEPTRESMDPAELEAAMAATGAIIEEFDIDRCLRVRGRADAALECDHRRQHR